MSPLQLNVKMKALHVHSTVSEQTTYPAHLSFGTSTPIRCIMRSITLVLHFGRASLAAITYTTFNPNVA